MARTSSLAAALLVASLFAIGVSDAAAAGHVYVTAWGTNAVDVFTTGPSGALSSSFVSKPAGSGEPWYGAMSSNGRNLYVATYTGFKLEAFNVAANGALTHIAAG